ncbi:translocase [Salipiger bermudensis]|uniref:translocase n=1 Tax=Salipiger bermudensis TaxID=344736 RepID=UPI001C999DD9|nr:translocase [Salipiger bermudensis]MBY6003724.1 translocase [Salipiger bermudensis]
MARLKTYLLAAVTVCAALAIGFVMQSGAQSRKAGQDAGVVVSDITDTSSAAMPRLPVEAALAPDLAGALATLQPAAAKAVSEPVASLPEAPQDRAALATVAECGVALSAEARAGAMVALSLRAPCFASERVTIHHHGLMFTELTGPDGQLAIDVPALAQKALFIASFDNDAGATAVVEVPALPFYDRVALQWRDQAGLQLHAREFGADYFSEGHVWAASAGDMGRTAKGVGGFLTRLGNPDAAAPRMAEIYSFPAGAAQKSGEVAVSVEAELTAANCGKPVEAQTLELRGEAGLRVHDLTLDLPACDSVGDFLVLKNLIEDLKIATN